MPMSSDHDNHLQILSQLVEIHYSVFNCILFSSELAILNFNDQVVLDYLINSKFRYHGMFKILLILTLFCLECHTCGMHCFSFSLFTFPCPPLHK